MSWHNCFLNLINLHTSKCKCFIQIFSLFSNSTYFNLNLQYVMYCGELKLITWPIYVDMILWEGYRHIAGMKISKITNNIWLHAHMGSFYFLPSKSTRLMTNYIIWKKWFSLVSFINILHVIPLCAMTFIESAHKQITNIILWQQYWQIVAIQVTTNTMNTLAYFTSPI